MSELLLVSAALLQCKGCARTYELQRSSDGTTAIPRLRRSDRLATLAQDIVTYYDDPDSARLDRRALVAQFEGRERFLAALMSRVPVGASSHTPDAILAAQPEPSLRAPTAGERAALDRFVAPLPAQPTVLDLACGRGAWTRRLAERGARVLGMDGSLPSLERAAGSSGAFVEADMMEMPLATASMDGVWCSEAFEYVRPDRRTVFFRQIHRVLRPGGVLFLSAETAPLYRTVRQYLLWRYVFHKPVIFWEYIYRLPAAHGGGWHYHAMTGARTLRALCRDHSFTVLSLRREGLLWLLVARKAP